MQPHISILTPTYNQERFIGQCVESVLSQTLPDWEMLIVDDGSRDGTCDVIKTYKDDRIILLCQEHRGIWRLRETYAQAMERARGPFVAILDGDDFWPKHKLEVQTRAFHADDVVISFGSCDHCGPDGANIARRMIPRAARGTLPGIELITMILRNEFYPYSVTVMARKKAIEDIGGFVQPEDLPVVDLPTWMNILCGKRCVGLTETLGCYRIHGQSVCRTYPDIIDEGDMTYRESFLDSSWRRMGLAEAQWKILRQELLARYSHRRAYRRMRQGRWREALCLFLQAMHVGDAGRRMKSGARLAQTLGMMVWREYALRALGSRSGRGSTK